MHSYSRPQDAISSDAHQDSRVVDREMDENQVHVSPILKMGKEVKVTPKTSAVQLDYALILSYFC